VNPSAPNAGLGNTVLADVWLEVDGLIAGAAAELWIIDGLARALDLTTDGEVWPDVPRARDAWYGRPSEADPERLERTRERDLSLVSRGRSA
jgi:hypothetical protein